MRIEVKDMYAAAKPSLGRVGHMAMTHDDRRIVRARIRAWVLHFRALYYQDKTDKEMAEDIGIGPTTLHGVISGKRSAGLDVTLAIARKFHVPLDLLVSAEPSVAWPMLVQAKTPVPSLRR